MEDSEVIFVEAFDVKICEPGISVYKRLQTELYV